MLVVEKARFAGGVVTVSSRVVIDCTGDADVCAWEGVPYEQSAAVQQLTLHFRIVQIDAAKMGEDFAASCRETLVRHGGGPVTDG